MYDHSQGNISSESIFIKKLRSLEAYLESTAFLRHVITKDVNKNSADHMRYNCVFVNSKHL